MSLLIKPNEFVEVTIYIRENKDGTVQVLQPSDWKKMKEADKTKFAPFKFSCRRLGFKANNDLTREANKGDVWDGYLFREKKLFRILAAWDIKDGGVAVPVNDQMISLLDPVAAMYILNQYDELCIVGDDKEEKKEEKDENVKDAPAIQSA